MGSHHLYEGASMTRIVKTVHYLGWAHPAEPPLPPRGRSFAQLSAYTEAGIERYLIEAGIDECTTDICRVLHGKNFSMRRGLEAFERAEANRDAIWFQIALAPNPKVTPSGGPCSLLERRFHDQQQGVGETRAPLLSAFRY